MNIIQFFMKKNERNSIKKEIENNKEEEEIKVNITLYNTKGKIIKST